MAINKVQITTENGVRTLVDLTGDTVTPETLAEGVTAHDASGEIIVGTMRSGEDLEAVLTEQAELIDTLQATLNHKASGEGGVVDTRFKALIENTLTEIDDDTITSIRAYAFRGAILTKARFPNTTSIGSYSFSNCAALVSIDLPSLAVAISTYTFDGCSALTRFNAPNCTGANNYSFQDTTTLEKVELGVATSIGSYSFRRSGIKALIIRNYTSKLTKLTATNAFTDCPIANGTGYIYFPREYVDNYKSASGWSAYASQIRAIEDYPEICGGEA